MRQMMYGMGETILGGVVGGSLLGISIVTVIVAVVFAFFWYIIQAVGYWKTFQKAGEAGWKAIIPFYSTYVRYKLTWDVKLFWIAVVLMVAEWVLPQDGNFVLSLVRLAVSIGYLVINVKAFHRLSRSFGHGVGFTVGLFFLEPIFALILGLDGSRYEGIPQ